uniref:uncharacterized protein LOC114594556 isoform X2 n=1 Tax=Podarcis muralis TaxID=64176 RepID=UPI00109F27D6|nr:uncharacterized protein LOC114594556 isoform X2 [Podarcis muralis]
MLSFEKLVDDVQPQTSHYSGPELFSYYSASMSPPKRCHVMQLSQAVAQTEVRDAPLMSPISLGLEASCVLQYAVQPQGCQHLTWNPGGSGFSPKLTSHAGLWYGITDDNLYIDFVGP